MWHAHTYRFVQGLELFPAWALDLSLSLSLSGRSNRLPAPGRVFIASLPRLMDEFSIP